MARKKADAVEAEVQPETQFVIDDEEFDPDDMPKSSRARTRKPTEFDTPLWDSYQNAKAKRVRVSNDQVEKVRNKIHNVAAAFGIRARVTMEEYDDGTTGVYFVGLEKLSENDKAALAAEQQAADCPKCGAVAGSPCVTSKGEPTKAHKPRLEAVGLAA